MHAAAAVCFCQLLRQVELISTLELSSIFFAFLNFTAVAPDKFTFIKCCFSAAWLTKPESACQTVAKVTANDGYAHQYTDKGNNSNTRERKIAKTVEIHLVSAVGSIGCVLYTNVRVHICNQI